MESETSNLHVPISNDAFSAFTFSVLGWALLQGVAFHAGITVAGHTLTALIGFYVVAVVWHRYRLSPLALNAISHRLAPSRSPRDAIFDAGSCILLFAIGNIIARLMQPGWVFPLFAVSIFLLFVPWSRIPFCQRHFFVSTSLLAFGAAFQIILTGQLKNPIGVLLAVWVFWTSAFIAVLWRTVHAASVIRTNAINQQPRIGQKPGLSAHIRDDTEEELLR